ncbi:MAG: nitrilase-related carbon-nitrogen hydrolase, partial [Raoultibacter sp.]
LPGVFFNSSVFFDRAGELLGTFDKVHLWALERFYFRSGNEIPVFDTEFGKIGIMICYDLGFPEVARILTLKGAELIVCPSAWCEEDHDVWNYNTQCRALENTVFLAAVNRHGREESLYMGGHTRICNPRGGVIAELEEEKEGILYADLDFADVGRNRISSPYLRDRRADLYDEVML